MFKQCKVFVITVEYVMKKKFTKIGNSWAMLFTKTMLEMLNINPEVEQAEIVFEKDKLIITKQKTQD